jgi:hypothetical protein
MVQVIKARNKVRYNVLRLGLAAVVVSCVGLGVTQSVSAADPTLGQFGAVCDGTTDDTTALQNALDATDSGETLTIPSGAVCRHTGILKARNDGMRVVGPGKLLATDQDHASFWIEADNVTVEGNLQLQTTGVTTRSGSHEAHKIVLKPTADGAIVRHVSIDGAAGDGIFVYGASNYLIEDVSIEHTKASGITNTYGAHDGTINRATVYNPGDTGITVASFTTDPAVSQNITINSPKLYGQTKGSAFAVVGGNNITYKDIYAEDSAEAGIYIASELATDNRLGATNIQVIGGKLVESNQDSNVDHGAVLVSDRNSNYANSNIVVRDLTIEDTRSTASRQVGLITSNGGSNQNVQFLNLAVTGGPSSVFSTSGTSSSDYNNLGMTYNGSNVTDHLGYTNSVLSYGAICDGTTDDTADLQTAFDAMTPYMPLIVPTGEVCRHTDVLHLENAGAVLLGPGTLLATDEENSSVWVEADYVMLDNALKLNMGTTTQRWEGQEQHKLTLRGNVGDTIRNVTINGAAASGIFVGSGTHDYLIEDVTVQDTRADGIHNTGGSYDGTIRRPNITNTGDDGVSVVSYQSDGAVSHDINVISPRFYGQTHGRAYSVVGGDNITFSDIYSEDSDAAAIYIASEGAPYYTYASTDVKVLGGEVVNSNAGATTVDHGAVLVYNGNSATTNSDILIDNLTITNTNSGASRQTGILNDAGANQRVQFNNFTITNGPSTLFVAGTTPTNQYNTVGWSYNNASVADHVGFTP